MGTVHLVIDVIPSFVIYYSYAANRIDINEATFLLSIYIFLAFGIQFIFGYIADKVNNPKRVIQAGLILGVISLLVINYSLIISVIIIGIANSLVHVGGGIVALKIQPGKATFPGIYVAFGTIGLYEGLLLGKSLINVSNIVLLLISIIFIVLYFIEMPNISEKKVKISSSYIIPLIIIFLVIFLRSYTGAYLKFSSNTINNFPLLVMGSVFFGKLFGGVIADRFGWLKTTAISLIFASILLLLSPTHALFGLAVIFFFQITMPITLTIFGSIFPKNPGFAFGLTCLALYFGYYLSLINTVALSNNTSVIVVILSSLVLLTIGINKLFGLEYKHEYLPK